MGSHAAESKEGLKKRKQIKNPTIMRAGQLKELPMANDGLVLNNNDNKSHIKYNRKYNIHIC